MRILISSHKTCLHTDILFSVCSILLTSCDTLLLALCSSIINKNRENYEIEKFYTQAVFTEYKILCHKKHPSKIFTKTQIFWSKYTGS